MKHDYEAIGKKIATDEYTYCKGTEKEHISYDPVYFDQGYSDTNEEVMSAFVSGEQTKDGYPRWREMAEDVIGEWESSSIWEDARRLADEYEGNEDLPDDFDIDELRDAIQHTLEEIRTQDVALEWVRDMRAPHIRVRLTDEDDPLSWVEDDADWTPEKLATHAGIEHSEKNLKACASILANAYYPGTCKMLYLVFNMDIPSESIEGNKVRIVGEVELWACNPFMGDGMAETVDIDVTVERSTLATDKEQGGYSYEEVFGPSWHNFPQPELTFITTDNEPKENAA